MGYNRNSNYRHNYTEETIRQAPKDVTYKTMTLNETSVRHRVPKTKLYDKVTMASDKVGCPTVLTAEEEDSIVEHLSILGGRGSPSAPAT